jgi:hypothetical protein
LIAFFPFKSIRFYTQLSKVGWKSRRNLTVTWWTRMFNIMSSYHVVRDRDTSADECAHAKLRVGRMHGYLSFAHGTTTKHRSQPYVISTVLNVSRYTDLYKNNNRSHQPLLNFTRQKILFRWLIYPCALIPYALIVLMCTTGKTKILYYSRNSINRHFSLFVIGILNETIALNSLQWLSRT